MLTINTLQATARFQVKVMTPSVFEVECTTLDKNKEEFSYKILLKQPSGVADFGLDIAFPQFITLSYGSEKVELYIEPTDDIKISFTANNLLKTIDFAGEGAVNNRCWINFKRRFRKEPMSAYTPHLLSPQLDSTTVSRAKTWTANDFLTFANADKEVELDFIHQHKATIARSLYSEIWKNTIYTYDTKLYSYFLFQQMPKEEAQRIADRFFPGRGFNYADYDRNETAVFRNALKTFVHFQARLKLGDDENKDALYETIEKKITNYDRFWLEKELLLEVLNQERSYSFGRQRIEQYRKDCPFKELVKELDSKHDNYLDVTERAEAPNFKLVTAEGEVKHLSDFRGRVVFINFWASWCKPCLANFYKYANIRQQLYTEGVVLLNLSIDEQPPQYRTALSRINPMGINGQPLDMQEAKKQYSLYEIPAYYLVDKLGRLVHLSDKQGGDVAEFRKLLAE
ncbi:MAG: TlpA disulfide reductase family protein [Saprospiraceae bacterium]|nr:TlpA disulfide reductase family protein [Saprospiraceae bacterium]